MGYTLLKDEEQATGLLDERFKPESSVPGIPPISSTVKNLRRSLQALLIAYLVTAACFYKLYATMQRDLAQCRKLDLFPSLAHAPEAVQFKKMKLPVPLVGNAFVGDPRPELEHAWHGLFEDVNIRVTQKDLEYAELTSLPLADGSGDFIGQLGVHHELHCLKRIRRWIYRDHYQPNLTVAEFEENKIHIDHCIELIRVSTMCRGDTSLSTFKWLDTEHGLVTETRDVSYHSCVNYDALMHWVRGRSLDLFDPTLLVRPDELPSSS